MDYQAFYQQLKNKDIQRLYLFEGEEEYGKESALQALRQALLQGPMAMMNETVLTKPADSELIALCETLPIMEDRRLVIVRDSHHLGGRAQAQKEEDGEEQEEPASRGDSLTPYMDRLPDFLCLVFFVRGKANGARRLYKMIKALGGIVSFDQLDQERLTRWVQKEFQACQLQADRQVCEHLIFACGRELMLLKREVAKVAAYAQGQGRVSRADVDAIASLSVEYRVFDLADKVSAGQAGQALPLLRDMLQGGEQRLMLLALLQRHYRQLLITRVLMDERAPQATIAAQAGVPPFVVRRLQQAARSYDTQQLREAYSLCIQQEFLVKSGQLAEEGFLEQLVLRLIHLQHVAGERQHA